jgi:succinate dehydrogenase/fumarate reductase cytochrome b subunit
MTLRRLHGLSALFIAVYACVHIANHLVGLGGVESHIAFMRTARLVYRFPVVEVVLLMAIAFQICSGLTFVVRGWRQRQGFMPWLQAASGAYLVFFLFNHVGAVLFGRTILRLDTNFYYAAAGFYVPPFQFFFAPYYFLAVLALFTHLGCALYWQLRTKSRPAHVLALVVPSSIGLVLSLLIVLSLAGVFYPVQVPEEYKVIYGWHL